MKRNYEAQSPTNSMLKDKIRKKSTLKNDLKKMKSTWAHLLNSWTESWGQDYPIEEKKNHETQFSINPMMMDEIEKKNKIKKDLKQNK
jgi:hypothetical protein